VIQGCHGCQPSVNTLTTVLVLHYVHTFHILHMFLHWQLDTAVTWCQLVSTAWLITILVYYMCTLPLVYMYECSLPCYCLCCLLPSQPLLDCLIHCTIKYNTLFIPTSSQVDKLLWNYVYMVCGLPVLCSASCFTLAEHTFTILYATYVWLHICLHIKVLHVCKDNYTHMLPIQFS